MLNLFKRTNTLELDISSEQYIPIKEIAKFETF
ncbi:MAG: PolC-type DNA polymerase III N-terminal domain-containing protein [Clostridia bacterium]